MDKKYRKSLFLFRRDFRLDDNTGLLLALSESATVIPAFIFDPHQVDKKQNQYFSEPAFQFLLNSLTELADCLRKKHSDLQIFFGEPTKVVSDLINNDDIEAVYTNKDYTPFAKNRDQAIAKICFQKKVAFTQTNDYTLSPIETIRTGEGNIYTVFTPFMKRAVGYEVAEPVKNTHDHYFIGELKTSTVYLSDFSAHTKEMKLALKGGRAEGLSLLGHPVYLKNYKDRRNLIADTTGTSRLSAHHKFGTVSIRESYKMAEKLAGRGSQFISELYWRDFYYYIAHHFPSVFSSSFLPWAKHLKWLNDPKQFLAWCEGRTGVPIVDAGMRELNSTGFMHNRSRMITASYLTKNLLIDWRWGERYFASKLIDYDPAQNNGGWQWSASTSADPRPIRIFNPYTQAQKYDPGATYIKNWVPELRAVSDKFLTDGKTQNFNLIVPNYPAPLVDQRISFHRASEAYKLAKLEYRGDTRKKD